VGASLETWLDCAVKGDDPHVEEADLEAVETCISCRLPDELRHVLLIANRPEAFIGESYIAFFNLDDIVQRWCEVQTHTPGFIPFASNGGGEYYGIDSRQKVTFVVIPSIGSEWGVAFFLGSTWDEFWSTLQCGNLFKVPHQLQRD